MANPKVSTLVITLDRACSRCFVKIRKALCKLQESEDITAILFDEKVGTVTISGPFDPLVIPPKLRRKAGCVIRDIQLKLPEPKPAPPPAPPKEQAPALKPPVAPACGCHGAGCSCRCSCAFAPAPPIAAAALCYGVPYGGFPVTQFTCDEPSPACSIM